MSLLTSVTETSPGNFFFIQNPGYPISGVRYSNNWTAGVSSTIQTTIPVLGLKAGTPVQVSTQTSGGSSQDLTDAINCWVVTAKALDNNINVWVAAGGGGTGGAPVNNANYGLSWSVNSGQ